MKKNKLNKIYDKALEDNRERYKAYTSCSGIHVIDALDYAAYASKAPRDRGAHEQDIVEGWEGHSDPGTFSHGVSERIAIANEKVRASLRGTKWFDYGSLPCNQKKY